MSEVTTQANNVATANISTSAEKIILGKSTTGQEIFINLAMANRHGLITGATGTGKTVTLQLLAEGFAKNGVPVFTADIKGDLSGISQPAELNEKLNARISKLGISPYLPNSCPSTFWDIQGVNGIPVRATISEFGAILLSRLLDLNETQEGVLQITFRVADDKDLLMIDLKDLRAVLRYVAESADDIRNTYGNVSATSIGAIQRRLLSLEEAGADKFFGEPAIKLSDLMRTTSDGRGVISILDATKLIENSKLYSTFLLWLLSELFEELPEAGDLNKPKFVFFFDEAHLLFNDAPPALIEKVEKVVRLIRSKGVGIYFVTQSPKDVPTSVLGQLGNRVQHALRAYTPADTKVVQAAAENFRANPAFDTGTVITELEIGEALISSLDSKGAPQMVERTMINPPVSKIGSISGEIRSALINASPLKPIYETAIDRKSAHEMLAALDNGEIEELEDKKTSKESDSKKTEEQNDKPGFFGKIKSIFSSGSNNNSKVKSGSSSRRQTASEALLKSVLRSLGTKVGTQIARGILGSVMGNGRR